jgi:DNA-binding GntR family transcriptional regulator
LTDADVVDLYKVRRLLELSALADLQTVADGDLARVDTACDHLVSVVTSAVAIDDWAAICEADLDFHKSIVGVRTSPRLVRTFQTIRYELTFCLTLITAEDRRTGRTDRLITEHQEIRDAIVTRDSESASRLVDAHLDLYEAETRHSLAGRT